MRQSVNKEQIYHQKMKQSVKNLTDSLLICYNLKTDLLPKNYKSVKYLTDLPYITDFFPM